MKQANTPSKKGKLRHMVRVIFSDKKPFYWGNIALFLLLSWLVDWRDVDRTWLGQAHTTLFVFHFLFYVWVILGWTLVRAVTGMWHRRVADCIHCGIGLYYFYVWFGVFNAFIWRT